MEFSRPEYWSGQPFPSPGDLPNPGIKPRSPVLQIDSLPAEPQRKLIHHSVYKNNDAQKHSTIINHMIHQNKTISKTVTELMISLVCACVHVCVYACKPHNISVQFSCSVVSNSLQPHELQHARPPCPASTPKVHPNLCPFCRWCHPTISSSVVPFSFPSIRVFSN